MSRSFIPNRHRIMSLYLLIFLPFIAFTIGFLTSSLVAARKIHRVRMEAIQDAKRLYSHR